MDIFDSNSLSSRRAQQPAISDSAKTTQTCDMPLRCPMFRSSICYLLQSWNTKEQYS